MKTLSIACCLLLGTNLSAQSSRPAAKIERIQTTYNGKTVNARRLTVRSVVPMPVEQVWANVQTPALLQYVSKGMIRFKPSDGAFPAKWEEGKTYGAKMRIWGVLPFGGTHFLLVDHIDQGNYQISTLEWDRQAKIWNHQIKLRDLGNGTTDYEDTIVIYGGLLTGLITRFAKWFYIHRQKRWQKVAADKTDFSKPNATP